MSAARKWPYAPWAHAKACRCPTCLIPEDAIRGLAGVGSTGFDGMQLAGENGPIDVVASTQAGTWGRPPAADGSMFGLNRKAPTRLSKADDAYEARFTVAGINFVTRMDGRLVRVLGRSAIQAWEVMAHEVQHHLGSIRPLPDVEQLARALFRTDVHVREFVRSVADHHAPVDGRVWYDDARFFAAMETAWERDEGGWRTEAHARAEALLEALRGDR